MKSFEHLHIWQREMDLIKEIYRLTSLFPPEEKFNLISQMRRSSTGILANTAEGEILRLTRHTDTPLHEGNARKHTPYYLYVLP